MNNQEAIMRIKEHNRIHQICEPRAIKISEALDMAITALEAQELNCDGCVYQEFEDQFVDPCIRCKRNCFDYWKRGEE